VECSIDSTREIGLVFGLMEAGASAPPSDSFEGQRIWVIMGVDGMRADVAGFTTSAAAGAWVRNWDSM
jgi:hypothetical protein